MRPAGAGARRHIELPGGSKDLATVEEALQFGTAGRTGPVALLGALGMVLAMGMGRLTSHP